MRFPAFGLLLGFTDNNVIAIGPWYRALNQQQVLRLSHLDHFQVLSRPAHLAHMPRHVHAAHDRAREQALTDRARAAMPPFSAVRRVTSGKMVALHHTLESPPFGVPD